MADNIVIQFEADIEGMLPAVDILEKIGVIDAKTAEQFRKTNTVFKERQKAIQDIKTAQAGSSTEVDKTVKSYDSLDKKVQDVANTIAKGTLAEATKEIFTVTSEEIQKSGLTYDEFIAKLKGGTTQADAGTKSLRAQLQGLKNELSLLEQQGKENSDEFEQMSVKAAKLEDQIGDTSARIRNMADDSRGLKTLLEAVTGIAAGFQLMQGFAALAGEEDEELQKTLVQLNAVMAIANGLTQINTILQKESFLSTAATTLLRRAQTVSTQLNTAAESSNIIVRYAAIVAQKALNAAMAISPAGLLLTAMIAIAGALVYFTSSTEDAVEAQKKLDEQLNSELETLREINQLYQQVSDVNAKSTQRKIALAQAEGASEKELATLRRAAVQEQLENAEREFKSTEQQRRSLNLNLEELTRLETTKRELTAIGVKSDDIQMQSLDAKIKLLQTSTTIAIDSITKFEEAKNNIKVFDADADTKARTEQLKNAKAFADAAVVEAKKGTEEELKARVDAINKEKALQLNNVNLTAGEKKKIEAEANVAIQQEEQRFLQRQLEDAKLADQARLVQIQEGGKEELELKKSIIDQELQIELANVDLTTNAQNLKIAEAEKKKQDLQKAFTQKTLQEQITIDQTNLQRRLAITQAGSTEELQVKQDLVEASADLEKLNAQETIKNSELLAAKIKEIDAKTVREKETLKKDSLTKQLQIEKEIADAEIELENSKIKNKLADPSLSVEERSRLNAAIIANEKILLQNEIDLNEELHDKKLISEEEFQRNLLLLKKKGYDQATAEAQAAANKEKEIQDTLQSAILQTGQATADTNFQIQADGRQSDLNDALASIEQRRNAELSDKRLTEEQKKKIDEKFRKEEAAVKLKAWQSDQEAAKTQAEINGLLAITNILAQNAGNPIKTAILIAASIITTGLQISAIDAKKPPRFFEGTDFVTLDGNKPGKDTVPAMLTEGEGVDPVDINRDYSPTLKAIRRRKVAPEVLNTLISELPPDVKTIERVVEILQKKVLKVSSSSASSSSSSSASTKASDSIRVTNASETFSEISSASETSSLSSNTSSSATTSANANRYTNTIKSIDAISEKISSAINAISNSSSNSSIISGSNSSNVTSSSSNASRSITDSKNITDSKSNIGNFSNYSSSGMNIINAMNAMNVFSRSTSGRDGKDGTDQQRTLQELPSILDNIPNITEFTEEDYKDVVNITSNGLSLDYEKLSAMIAKKIADQMEGHVSELSYQNRRSMERGFPVSNLGQVVKAITESKQHDPYRP